MRRRYEPPCISVVFAVILVFIHSSIISTLQRLPFNEVINDLESHCTSNDAFLHAAFLLNFIQSTNGLCCPKAWFHLDSTLSLHPSQCLWCFFFIYFPFFYSWGILPSNKGLDTVGLKGAHQPDEGSVGFFFCLLQISKHMCEGRNSLHSSLFTSVDKQSVNRSLSIRKHSRTRTATDLCYCYIN